MPAFLCLLSIDYRFLIISSIKDLFRVQCHLWLNGGLRECKCKCPLLFRVNPRLSSLACMYDSTQPNTQFCILLHVIPSSFPSKFSGCFVDDNCSLYQNAGWTLQNCAAENRKQILCIKNWM